MNFIASKLTQLGGLMAVAGLVSLILSFFSYNIKLLRWIDQWGDETGLMIRIGLIAGGALLFMVGSRFSKDEPSEPEADA